MCIRDRIVGELDFPSSEIFYFQQQQFTFPVDTSMNVEIVENRKALTTVRNKKKELKDLDNHAYQAGSETSSNVVDALDLSLIHIYRITIDEVRAENGCLRLMKNLVWEYDALPHALIAGEMCIRDRDYHWYGQHEIALIKCFVSYIFLSEFMHICPPFDFSMVCLLYTSRCV